MKVDFYSVVSPHSWCPLTDLQVAGGYIATIPSKLRIEQLSILLYTTTDPVNHLYSCPTRHITPHERAGGGRQGISLHYQTSNGGRYSYTPLPRVWRTERQLVWHQAGLCAGCHTCWKDVCSGLFSLGKLCVCGARLVIVVWCFILAPDAWSYVLAIKGVFTDLLQSLKFLRNNSELLPYVIFLAAPGMDQIKSLYSTGSVMGSSSRNLTVSTPASWPH